MNKKYHNLKPMPLSPNYSSMYRFHTRSSQRITLIVDIFRIGKMTATEKEC